MADYPVDVNVTAIVPGTGATALGKAEDAAHTSGDTGVMILAVRQDTPAALAGTTGDYIPLTTDALGQARVLVGSPDTVVTATPAIGAGSDFTLDAGDVVTATTEIPAAVRANGGCAVLSSMVIACSADIAPAMSVVFFNAATSLGTTDGAPSITAANLLTSLGAYDVAASDWKDLGSCRLATCRNINLPVMAGAGTASIYFSVVNGAAEAAFGTSNALQFQFGLLRS